MYIKLRYFTPLTLADRHNMLSILFDRKDLMDNLVLYCTEYSNVKALPLAPKGHVFDAWQRIVPAFSRF